MINIFFGLFVLLSLISLVSGLREIILEHLQSLACISLLVDAVNHGSLRLAHAQLQTSISHCTQPALISCNKLPALVPKSQLSRSGSAARRRQVSL